MINIYTQKNINKRFLSLCSLCLVITCLGLLPGCQPKKRSADKTPNYSRPLPAGKLALRKITNPLEIPDFTAGCFDLSNLSTAIGHSLNYLQKRSSRQYYPYGNITHEKVVASLTTFDVLLKQNLSPSELNKQIREVFDIYTSVGYNDKGSVLFTGYYTPIFAGTKTPTAQFRYPLFKKPDNLIKNEHGKILGLQNRDGTFYQCPERRAISSTGLLNGLEIIWLSDPFEVYIAHVQGSAKIRLPDGELITVGYTANNGHPYRSITTDMIRDGVIDKAHLSLSSLIKYFKTNPKRVDSYVNRNPRFVFFDIQNSAPHGSINAPVTPLRTIATDKNIYPRAALAFHSVALPVPYGSTYRKQIQKSFVLDQDTGGAIRAPGRCDIYIGQGDLAGDRAGKTFEEGRLYYLFLK